MNNTTKSSRLIHASAETIYGAFTEADALESWFAPEGMTAKVQHFKWREGGGYDMSLFYPEGDKGHGKTSSKEDRYKAGILKLIPNKLIILAINFATHNAAFAGEMTIEITMDEKENGTTVTFFFKNIPTGIQPEDNEKGTLSTLKRLARYTEPKKEIDDQDSDGSANAFEGK